MTSLHSSVARPSRFVRISSLRSFVAVGGTALLANLAACGSSSSGAPVRSDDAGSNSEASTTHADAGKPEAATPAVTKRVFVTSGQFTGDLATQGQAADGLSGGDAICTSAATAAGLSGSWVAWLSTATTDASSRVDLTAIRVLVDGTTKIFDPAGSDGLVPLNELTMDENGDTLPTSGDGDGFTVWTATDGFGHYETDTDEEPSNSTDDACKGWTSASSTVAAVEGSLGAVPSEVVPASNWTDGAPEDTCDTSIRLYCFEK